MRKFLKLFSFIVLIIPIAFFFVGCDNDLEKSLRIKDIKQTSYDEATVTYTITYEDDSTFTYTVPINNTVSISGVRKTSSSNNVDTYTIELSNGESSTFTVTNGVSVENIVYSHSDGLRDYYTINYSNDTSSTISILNGKDGADGVSLEDMYEVANVDGKYANIQEFIEDYLSIEINGSQSTIATGKAILSAVSIYAEFPYNRGSSVSYGAGAGVIYSLNKDNGDAYVITNCHVVYNEDCSTIDQYASDVYCYLYGQEDIDFDYDDWGYVESVDYGKYGIPCEIIGASIKYDLAVLKIKGSEVLKNSSAKAIEVADSETVKLCDNAIAIGNPSMGGISVTKGVINVISEYGEVVIDSYVETILREFRIDTAVNSGNSGGGLFNDNGELIGIVNAKSSNSSIENIGFAIPSNVAVYVCDNIIHNYETSRNFGVVKFLMGISLDVKSSKSIYDSKSLTTKIIEEVVIDTVNENGVADSIGMKVGDVIKSITIFDGDETKTYDITRYYQVVDLMLAVRVGDVITFNCVGEEGNLVYNHTAVIDDFDDII